MTASTKSAVTKPSTAHRHALATVGRIDKALASATDHLIDLRKYLREDGREKDATAWEQFDAAFGKITERYDRLRTKTFPAPSEPKAEAKSE